ncbi:MAG: long-chain fatty acid--CoA ligase [Calditrichaceae bacterium]|nr:long-chain fatty acid--CoA ligase [Calditrichaceae bacterium]
MKFKNLGDMFFSKRNTYADKTAYMFKKEGSWQEVTFKEAVDKVEKISAGFSSLGIKKGDAIAIVSQNRLEWAMTDYAAVSLGALLVPIYPSLLPDQVKYILNDSEAKIVVAEDQTQLQKVESVKTQLSHTNNFFVLDDEGKGIPAKWNKYATLMEKGEIILKKDAGFITKQIDQVSADDWATIIYTSGTTGEPKGAILTHKNLLSNIESATSVLDVYDTDVFLSFLPLSHIFERMAGHYLSCYHSCTVAYAESIDAVAQNLTEIKPTLMVSVPRLYEKIFARVIDMIESGPPLKRKIFYWAVGVGKAYINLVMEHKSVPGLLSLKQKLAHKLVFHKLQDRVGGRTRFFVSGGAPLSADIAEFFGAAGIKILEGYGLTETSPVIAVNLEDNYRFGTVGPIVPGVEVKFAEDGEILTRGDHVMVGYFKKEEETKEAIDDEGWFYTGDIGELDDRKMLKITDRKKNIIVTSGGKNIAPQPIENMLITSQYIEQALVIGDKRKFCSAIIVPSEENMKSWAKEMKIEFSNYSEMIALSEINKLIQSEIEKVTIGLASYETIKNFIFAKGPFTIETGELTPSLKIKRNIVEKNYASDIDKMYAA